MNIRRLVPAAVALLAFLTPTHAHACAACWGDTSGSRMGNAATWSVVVMAIIMFAMLGAVAAFGFYLRWRAKNPLPDYSELLKEDGTTQAS